MEMQINENIRYLRFFKICNKLLKAHGIVRPSLCESVITQS